MNENRPDQSFRVASYNIRKCVGTDRRRDAGRVLEVVAGLGADIVALQEADLRFGRRRSALPAGRIFERTGLRPVALDHSAVSLGWHGNAMLLAPGIDTDHVDAIALPGLEPRGALRIDLRRGGTRLRLVAVHLGLRRRDRLRQLAAIRNALAALSPVPTMILGDFNEWSADRGLEPLTGHFAVLSPGQSWHARLPVAPLDRFALSADLELVQAGVEEGDLARRASDHLPVWAQVVPTQNRA
ncbi:endonuclease/exonuclease/phosphatase family protein [Thalassococcus sp. CAU 1522]|uniref:Endonuclease/exonuclease/phosphatase family protein n=1 Tax=Thalassococcus arenae TaxID=2851652 RepID=A0ABS6N6K3_9RHOB|nr:endonuclease/exonuclease/phosphatase family protein [Thalassococcus arenae]MBV2359229.1 endonuclease/exonuclease/phosphatase family protein [Thalassococcus arenae]